MRNWKAWAVVFVSLLLLGAALSNQAITQKFGWSGHLLQYVTSTASAPTTTEVGTGSFGWHYNTTTGVPTWNWNRSGTLSSLPVRSTSTDVLLGRSTSGAGNWEEIACTATGRSILDDASASAVRTTLGATTAGGNLFTLANPSAVRFLRVNADNSVTALSASATLAAINADSNTQVVVATGTAATDTAALIAAFSACQSATYGRIVIVGRLELTAGTYIGIPANCEIMGAYPGCCIDGNGGGSRIDFGQLDTFTSGTSFAGISQWRSEFATPSGLSVGDYAVFWSSDVVSGIEHDPHHAPSVGAQDFAGELHRVVASEAGTSIIDSPVVDPMTTSPLYKETTMYRQWIHDLDFEAVQVVPFRLAESFITNCTFTNCAPSIGATGFSAVACYHLTVANCVFDVTGVAGGIATSVSSFTNGVSFSNCRFTGSGHAFTTSAGRESGVSVWGTARHIIFDGNVVHATRTSAGGSQPIDSHSNGYNVWINNNHVTLTGYVTGGGQVTTPTACVNCRARRAVVTNNLFEGDSNADSIITLACGIKVPDVGAGGLIAHGNTYSRLGCGLFLEDQYGGHHIENEHFDQIKHTGIRIYLGDNGNAQTVIKNCTFKQHLGDGAGYPVANAWITIEEEDIPVLVSGCVMPKSGNTYSVRSDDSSEADGPATTVVANLCYGYGSGSSGASGGGIAVDDNYKDP